MKARLIMRSVLSARGGPPTAITRMLPALLIVLLLVGSVPGSVYAQSGALIPIGSEWRYNDKGSDLGSAWREPAFDDHDWKSGKAPLGYGIDGAQTSLSFGKDPSQKYPTYYFRTTFDVTDPTVLPNMIMKIRYDDGFVAYLNGREIARGGLPSGGEVSFATLADDHVDKGQRLLFETFNLASQRAMFVAGKNVLAIEVHQHSLVSSDVVLDVSLEPATTKTAPQVTMGPALGQMRRDSAHVLIASDLPTLATIQYGPTAAFGTEQRVRIEAVVHDFILGGLKPNTTYYYRIGLFTSPDQTPIWSDTRSFRTDGGPGTPFRFGIWAGGAGSGDAKELGSAIQNLTDRQSLNLAVAIGMAGLSGRASMGDIVGDYTQYYGALKSLVGAVPLYSSPSADVGNGCDACLAGFQNYLPNPTVNGGRYYSFDYGDAHFIVLNSSDGSASVGPAGLGSEQLDWLSNDLATKTRSYTFVFMEHSLFDAADRQLYSDQQRDALHRLFKAAKVTAVFAGGAAYAYQDLDGLPYITTSNLMSPSATSTRSQLLVVDVQPAAAKLIALSATDGSTIEEHTLAQQPGIAPIAATESPVAGPSSATTTASATASGPSMALVALLFIIGLAGGAGIGWVYWRRTQW
jgi:hypothetical protein